MVHSHPTASLDEANMKGGPEAGDIKDKDQGGERRKGESSPLPHRRSSIQRARAAVLRQHQAGPSMGEGLSRGPGGRAAGGRLATVAPPAPPGPYRR